MSFAEFRKRAELTQADVAQRLKINQSTVALWEAGKTSPRAALLPKIAKLYGCTTDDLLSDVAHGRGDDAPGSLSTD